MARISLWSWASKLLASWPVIALVLLLAGWAVHLIAQRVALSLNIPLWQAYGVAVVACLLAWVLCILLGLLAMRHGGQLVAAMLEVYLPWLVPSDEPRFARLGWRARLKFGWQQLTRKFLGDLLDSRGLAGEPLDFSSFSQGAKEGTGRFEYRGRMARQATQRVTYRVWAAKRAAAAGEGQKSMLLAPVMKATLTGADFVIVRVDDEVRPVLKDRPTEWSWDVTARKTGDATLTLALEAPQVIEGLTVFCAISTHTVTIEVTETLMSYLRNNAQYCVGTAIAALGLIMTIIGLPWITEILRETGVVQAAPSQVVAPDAPASAPPAVPPFSPAPFPASAPGSAASG